MVVARRYSTCFARSAAFCNRQRFLVAAVIRFRPSSLSFRYGFSHSAIRTGAASPRSLAHRAF